MLCVSDSSTTVWQRVVDSIFLAVGLIMVGGMVWDYVSYMKTPDITLGVRDERFYISDKEVEKSDIKSLNYTESPDMAESAESSAAPEVLLADGKKIKCKYVKNVKEVYKEIIWILRGISFDDAAPSERFFNA